MRITGYILLVFGFLWISWAAFACDAIPRSLDMIYHDRFSTTNSYSGDQVWQTVDGVLRKYQVGIPRIALPGILMLVGGILLDQAARRDTKRKPPVMHDEKPVA